ncbi:hypothetical protein CYY_008727 [Polysphondylium violaceum]|uniref:BSD domain-containing protein n=1 Tax=Polysphondylium violaceum TaxID=133409 RepID=A0A8J4PMZ6_9MYCE|nr:hypothetical protein CYY_008727 [Polysphondylium violaceum]
MSSDKENTNNNNSNDNKNNSSGGGGWGFGGWGFNNIIESVQKINITTVTESVYKLNETVSQMNIVDTIKSKSDQMVNIYKEDLKEFSNSLLGDTSTVLSNQLDNVKQYIPASATAVLEGLQENINNTTSPRNSNTSSSTTTTSTSTSSPSLLGKSGLLKSSLSFFTSEPGDIQEFELWCRDFGDIESHSLEINTILSGDEAIKSLYLQYVPSKTSHQQFWLKYFYKQYKSRKEEERRKLIFEQVSKDEEIGWDDDEYEDEDGDQDEIKENNIQEEQINNNNDSLELNQQQQQQQQQEDKDKEEKTLDQVQEIRNTEITEKQEDVYIDSDDELDKILEMKYQEELKQKQDTPKQPPQPKEKSLPTIVDQQDLSTIENDTITTTLKEEREEKVQEKGEDEEDVFDWE